MTKERKGGRLIAFLLTVVMLVGLLPLTAFAAEPTTLIGGLTLDGIAAPVAGESPARSNSVVTGLTGCYINWSSSFTRWRGLDGSSLNGADHPSYAGQKFNYDTTYTLSLWLEAEAGYAFDPTATELTNWTLGGVAATYIDMRSATGIIVEFLFPATGEFEGTIIDGLALGGIAAPVAGESSERDSASITGLEGCTFENDGYNVGWWNGNSYYSGKFALWATPKNFDTASVYSICLRFNAPEDARFDVTARAASNWTLNGINASAVSIEYTTVNLLFTFPATGVGATIENANVILPLPVPGGSATAEEYTTAIIPEDAPYTVSAVTWRRDSPTGSIFTGTFTENSWYYPSVILTPKDMVLPFTSVTTLTLNGVPSNDKTVSGGEMTVQKGFMSSALGTATLGNIEITTRKVGYGSIAAEDIPFSVTSAASLKNAEAKYSGATRRHS